MCCTVDHAVRHRPQYAQDINRVQDLNGMYHLGYGSKLHTLIYYMFFQDRMVYYPNSHHWQTGASALALDGVSKFDPL